MTTIEPTNGSEKKTEIIAFSSGKGGTGKTLIATCLGYALTKIGLRVLIIDTDTATDGISLYLLGPDGAGKVKEFPLTSTLEGILRQFKAQGSFQFKPWKINRSLPADHGVIYEAIISGRQIYGDRFDNTTEDEANTQLGRDSYRKVIQTMFDSLRAKAEYDYVIVDTRGGFSNESTDVSALADSYIVVTEADVTSFYQNRNLIQYIDQAASDFDKKAVLRAIIVNKSTQFTSTTSDLDLDNLESSFRLLLEKEFPIDYKSTYPFPLSLEALTVQKSHMIPIRHALDSYFSYAFLVAFHKILSVVTQPWTKDQVAEWNYLVESVNLAIQKRNEALQKAEMEEQAQHKELEKLRKDNVEYVNRISSLEREISEIHERYKRELERSDVLASKLENGKDSKAQLISDKTVKPRRKFVPGLIAVTIFAIVATLVIMGRSWFLSAAASTSEATLTTVVSEPSNMPVSVPTETATIQPAFTPTLTPTDTQTPTGTINATTAVCSPLGERQRLPGDVAHFVDETVPVGSHFNENQVFQKTWIVRNVGSTTWTTNYSVAFATGTNMKFLKPEFFSSIVEPGECIDITISLVAPSSPGTYIGNWILQDAKQVRFNFEDPKRATLDVTIIVLEPTATVAP